MLKPDKTWLSLSLFTLILSFLVYLLKSLAPIIIHEGAYFIILFFFIFTLLTHYVAVSAIRHSQDKFTLVFFASMSLRLLISIAIVVVALLQDIPYKIAFALNFAVTYLLFLIFEIYALLTTLRSNFQKRAENAEKH